MAAAPQVVLNNLQGHQVVLQQEIAEINADIAVLQQMHNRYSSQNGIYFDASVHNLIALRCEKEALLNKVSVQAGQLNDTIQQTSFLAANFSRMGGAPISTSFNNPNASVMMQNGGGGFLNGNNTTMLNVSTAPTQIISSAPANSGCFHCSHHCHNHHLCAGPAPSAVNINTPNGLVVTTNSTILTNSPRRVYRQ